MNAKDAWLPPVMASSALLWKAGALLTSSGIASGAFGAHALASRLGDKASTWTMASHYAMINGVGLLAISQHPKYARKLSGLLIASGTVLFSGSIFALLLHRHRIGKVAGPLTPIGGVLMIAGYASLLL